MTHLTHWRLYVDGASRNNPGDAGIGFVLLHGSQVICQEGFFIGTMTNNSAEYLALIIGLLHAHEHVPASEKIAIYADSQLLIRQLLGEYKIKQPHLQQFAAVAHTLLRRYHAQLHHVLREHNTRADAMANKGIDERQLPPQEILQQLRHVGIHLTAPTTSV